MSSTKPSNEAPWPGSHAMPQWSVAELTDPPKFSWGKLWQYLGPSLIMGGAAIGGGEWLTGPTVTAKFGGGLMWLATLSILGQVIYNTEISRYTLYCGEPIFTGKFRTPPGPLFWVYVYLLLDLGSIFPYLASNAAVPVGTLILDRIPDERDTLLMKSLAVGIFLLALVPLIFGGKIASSLKVVMTFKLVTVFTFLLILAFFFSKWSTWEEICSGFYKVGNVPVKRTEDLNGNQKLDSGEDWDGDGKLDLVEPELNRKPPIDADGDGVGDSWHDANGDEKPDRYILLTYKKINKLNEEETKKTWWPDWDEDGKPDSEITIDQDFDNNPEFTIQLNTKNPERFIDFDSDNRLDGDGLENLFTAKSWPKIDLAMIAMLSALVAISGQGGLTNAPISNYTRDQGWGMGHHVGAIPSVVGGQTIELSHEGTVFQVNEESLPRWRGWFRHMLRDQLVVWMPACFIGIALPSMLSVQFLNRGTTSSSDFDTAVMTAKAVGDQTGSFGTVFYYLMLLCAFLVLAPTMATTIDGIVRRWVDVFWTSSKRLRSMETSAIRYVYFTVLVVYSIFGITTLVFVLPNTLLKLAGIIYNYALGFSCLHTLVLNHLLLPRPLRPNWFQSTALCLAGVFFLIVAFFASYSTLDQLDFINAAKVSGSL